jgi:imidazolonepropionase-like amidohydrolase/Tol biopolymer transport system component
MKKNTILAAIMGCLLTTSPLHIIQAAELKQPSGDTNTESKKWDVNNPPGEAYWADIEVDQGTWMNVDVSPDGKTIIFDLLGDIYQLPITGGDAKPLTHSIAWEMQPRFSPDGSQIALTSDQGGGDNIWLMDSNGENLKQLTKESFRLLNSPSWSPDGDYIAAKKHFTSQRSLGAGEIWLYHKAGGSGLQLNKRPNDQKDLGEPAFSADGKKVFFSRDSTPGAIFEYSKDSNQGIYEIFSIERSNGKIRKEVSAMGGSVRPSPSPDGKYLAFVRRIRNQSSLFLRDLETGKETPVYQNLDRDMQETWAIHGVYPNISWTPDSQNLIFWAGGKLHNLDRTTRVAIEIPFKVKTRKSMRKAVKVKVDPAPESIDTKMLRWTQVRPDGKQVVFQTLGQLYTRNLPNGKAKRLTNDSKKCSFYPSYSADGQWITYVRWNDDQLGSVQKIRSKGGKSKQLTQQPGKYLQPKFSADGKHIIYRKVVGGRLLPNNYDVNPGIYQIASDGGNARKITDNGSNPFYSKSGERIFVTRFANKQTQLVSLNHNGLDPIIHASSAWATEFSLSPNEKYLSFKERYHVYVTPFTHASKAIQVSPKTKNLPLLKLNDQGGNYISWSQSKNGQSLWLNWSLGNTLHQRAILSPESWGTAEQAAETKQTSLGFSTKSDIPEGSLLLSGAKIITMKGDQVIQKGDILVQGNRIAAIGESGSLSVPSNAKQINLNGKTVIPGLVDVHWHGAQGSYQITPQQNWMNLASLAFGVTTIHDPSNDTQEIFAAAELARAGKQIAPRIFSTGRILYGAESYQTATINGLKEATEHLQRLKQQGAFSVKSYNQPRRDQRQQILEAARQNDIMVVPEGGSTFQHNLTMIVDGHSGIEHSIPMANIYDDVKQLWSQSQTGYTPTLVVAFGGIWGENYWYQHHEVWKHPILNRYVPKEMLYPRAVRRTMAPKEDYNHFNNARVAAELQDIGVSVQLGAHGQREGLGSHWEMWMFAQGGMTPLEVIRASTIDSARYIGMDQHIGSLEVNKLADLVVLDVDPTQDIYKTDQVNSVMINGRLYDSKTMNEVGNHPKERKELFFR